jgi:hypothetical protein
MSRCPSDSYMQKPVGRPRSRWLNEINTDARRMGIRLWWRKASDREEWRKLLMEAKTLSCRAEDVCLFYEENYL